MKSFKQYLNENTITAPTDPNSMSFWHGGNLEKEFKGYKKDRYEYGAGLYLTTSYDVAKGYSKGSRKLYMITIKKGKDLAKTRIDFEKIVNFVDDYVKTNKRREVLSKLDKYSKDGSVLGYIFNNILLNSDALRTTNLGYLIEFYLEEGIDYYTIGGSFGFNRNTMLLLFNTDKIVNKVRIGPKDEIEEYDLEYTIRG